MRGILVALSLLVAAPAFAEGHLAVGWGTNAIEAAGERESIDDALVHFEVQQAVGDRWWVGTNVGTSVQESDGNAVLGKSKSLALRGYYGRDDAAAFPGLGVAAYDWQHEEIGVLSEDTILLGPEVLLEFTTPAGLPVLPGERVLARIGVYFPLIGQDDVRQVGFGLDYLIGAE